MSVANSTFGAKEIGALLSGRRRLWFVGIGGVHMAALACLARARGFLVAGSDRTENEQVRRLRALGVPVCIGHSAENVRGAEAVVYTLAISPDNPEYRYARERGLPLISRADFLGFLMGACPSRVGVAGSHGKSTVTAMLGRIFEKANRDPTVVCGAVMRHVDSTFCVGAGQDFIFEACEYGDSFLRFSPTVSLILNAELDHADYFPDKGALLRSFGAFACLATKGVVLPYGDGDLWEATKGAVGRLTFGFEAGADYRAEDVALAPTGSRFHVSAKDGTGCDIRLPLVGEHQIQNALAAAATAHFCGVEMGAIGEALSGFEGTKRRMEYKGTLLGVPVFDDYAHHPTEVAATLRAARRLAGGGRVVAVFQSHTYTRTKAFLPELAKALSLADAVLVPDIYAARESDTMGMSGDVLAARVGGEARYTGSLCHTAEVLLGCLQKGDLLVIMGAGDVGDIFAEFSAKGFTLKDK